MTSFASHLSAGDGANRLTERFGPMAFDLDARADAPGFELVDPRRALVRRAPAPRSRRRARGAGASVDEHGRYRFDVLITLPVVGRLVRYRGWLAPVISAPSP